MRRFVTALVIGSWLLGCGSEDPAPVDPGPVECGAETLAALEAPYFTDISAPSGIQADNFDPDPPANIAINDHSRLTFADLNGDGLDDAVMHSLWPNVVRGIPYSHRVFLNRGDGAFEQFSEESGLRDAPAAFFVFGDVDNDGDQDAFAGWDIPGMAGDNAIYLNDGEAHFTRLEDSGVELGSGNAFASTAIFADFDGDADLDLFVGNGETRPSTGPASTRFDVFYLNEGDGHFVDASERLPQNAARASNGSVACDYDNDGDLDIFVSVYGVDRPPRIGQNFLWENDGGGNFTDVALQQGFHAMPTGNYRIGNGQTDEEAAVEDHVSGNGFGLDCADINNDGYLDVFQSNISHPERGTYTRAWSDPTVLLINGGPDNDFRLSNEFLTRDLIFNEGDVDASLMDFDNDGRIDLGLSRAASYQRNYTDEEERGWFGLFHQLDDGAFESVGLVSGINRMGEAYNPGNGAQNHAWADIDHDGDLDLLVGGRGGPAGRPNFLFRNDAGSENAWFGLRLQGDGNVINRDAIGARVTVRYTEDHVVMREVRSSRGMYSGTDSRLLLFGLGNLGCEFTIEVLWPDGERVELDPHDIEYGSYGTFTYPDQLSASL